MIGSVQIYLSGLYFWAGVLKVFNWAFYECIAPSTFFWVYDILDYFFEKFPSLERITTPEKLFLLISIGGVSVEALMGLIFFFASFRIPLYTPFILDFFVLFNVFLHVYIVIFIGYRNGILTFWCWNMMTMTLTNFVFHSHHMTTSNAHLNLWNYVMFFIMCLYPTTVLIGKCPNGVLSHAYFAPGW